MARSWAVVRARLVTAIEGGVAAIWPSHKTRRTAWAEVLEPRQLLSNSWWNVSIDSTLQTGVAGRTATGTASCTTSSVYAASPGAAIAAASISADVYDSLTLAGSSTTVTYHHSYSPSSSDPFFAL